MTIDMLKENKKNYNYAIMCSNCKMLRCTKIIDKKNENKQFSCQEVKFRVSKTIQSSAH